MKKQLITLILLLFSIISNAQNEFERKYSLLLDNLQKESWQESSKLCDELLNKIESVDSMITPTKVLRYIKIYSLAGQLNERQITKNDAVKLTQNLKGKEMRMPAHLYNEKCYINCTHLSKEEKNTFNSFVNNAQGTQIFSFEYVKIDGEIKETPEEMAGKFLALEGILDEISVEGNMLPRFKLKFIKGKYKIFAD